MCKQCIQDSTFIGDTIFESMRWFVGTVWIIVEQLWERFLIWEIQQTCVVFFSTGERGFQEKKKKGKINIGVKKRRMSSTEDIYSTEEEYERLKRARSIVSALENTPPLPLWRLFREALLNGGACRDIVEKHVMCKLNGTDLKFLYGVNTETRKLVKRSSRADDLEEG